MQIIKFIYAACFTTFLLSFGLYAQTPTSKIEDVRKKCLGTGGVAKPDLLISPFHVSGSFTSEGMGREMAEKLIERLGTISCFNYNKRVSYFIPEGSQVVVTGDIKDYYTSEGKLGKPRINFTIEIRKSTTQELIASKDIKGEGKLYLGVGNNKPLTTLWNQVMDEAVVYLYDQIPLIAIQAKATEDKEKVGDTQLSFKDRVNRKSVWDQMKDRADEKRAEDRKLALNVSDYYNDTVLYKEFPKIPNDQFLEYTINGKKYQFTPRALDINKSASIHAYEGYFLNMVLKYNLALIQFPMAL